jgi:hypothetical protein
MKAKKPKVKVIVKGALSKKKKKRERPKWEKKKRQFIEDYNRPGFFAPGIREAIEGMHINLVQEYLPRQMTDTVLTLIPNDAGNRFKDLPMAADIVNAMRRGLEDAAEKAKGLGVAAFSVEGRQLERLGDVFSVLGYLLDCTDENSKKRFVGLLIDVIVSFGIDSEKKHAADFEDMRNARKSPDEELDELARRYYREQTEQEKSPTKAAQKAARELHRNDKDAKACAARLKQRISREARRRMEDKR